MKGQILWWSDRDKNGVIKTETGAEYYFDRSVLKGFQIIGFKYNVPVFVTFDVNEKIIDCKCAKNVQLEG